MAQKGSIEERIIKSDCLNEDVSLLIYLPQSYSPLLRYPLLIAQDGADYFKLGKITSATEDLIDTGEIDEFIIIGIPYKNVRDRREKYHPSGKRHSDYVRFLVNELVPYIESEFSTLELPDTRVLIGDSLGATVSLIISLAYPRTFGKVILQSPLVNDTVLEQVNRSKHLSMLSIYHVAGVQETDVKTTTGTVKNFIEPNRLLNKTLSLNTVNYHYEEFNGDHKWTYWQPDIPKALKFMFSIE